MLAIVLALLLSTAGRAQDNLKRGAELLKAGKWQEAAEELRAALLQNPYSAVAHDNLGICYFKLGQPELAIEEFKAALSINPRLSDTHNNLGYVYLALGRFAEAEAEFKEALAIDPKNDAAHNNLGRLYLEQKRYAEAGAEIEEALAINPTNEEARANREKLAAQSPSDRNVSGRGARYFAQVITAEPAAASSDSSGRRYYLIDPAKSAQISLHGMKLKLKLWLEAKSPARRAVIYWSFHPPGAAPPSHKSLEFGATEHVRIGALELIGGEILEIEPPSDAERLLVGSSLPLYFSLEGR